MREYKAVSGKCYTCAALSNMRKKYGDKVRREYLTQLFQLHRTAYMGERMEYMTRSIIITLNTASTPSLILLLVNLFNLSSY